TNKPPDADESKSKKKAADKKAQTVYRERAARPTFARVYLGDGNALELVSMQVTTTIEGPRARTVVDHIFYNPYDRQLEGTFEYPLPANASPSYFAMFLGNNQAATPPRFGLALNTPALPQRALGRLTPAELAKHVNTTDWGHLQEAHVVARAKALDIYEQVIRQRVDPALLEYSAGNTFSGRVFPIPAKGYNRVILAYEELLPCTDGTVIYNYPLPDCKLQELHYSLSVSAADTKQAQLNLKGAKREEGGGRVRYSKTWTKQGPGGSVQFGFVPPDPQVQVISGRQNESGPLYLYARIRPNLKVQDAKPYADHAVFLLDTSYSEQPDGFARNMKLLRAILEADSGIKHFNVLAFNIGATWLQPGGWFDNTAAGRQKAFGMLDGIVLEGATDLSVALDKLAHPGFDLPVGAPLAAFLLSDGDITWGQADVNTLVARFEDACPYRVRFNCYRTGLGADNLTLFDALTRKGGGEFNCFTDNVKDVALAHRSQCLQVDRVSIVGLPGVSDVLVAGRQAAIFPGGELIVTGRVNAPGHGTLLLEGTFLGQKFTQEYPLDVKGNDELAPRGWGEVAVASLLALNDPTYDDLVTAYCQQFGIGSRVASFLVLENENDYKRLNLEAERGKLVKDGDLGRFLEASWETLGKAVSPREAFERFLTQMAPRVHLFDGPNAAHVKALLRTLADKDYDLPASNPVEALVRRSDVSPDYLQARAAPGDNSDAFIAEAKRRLARKDRGGAVRALSTIIEEFPGRSDALRLVGYR
ncbi:MAG TPA: VIT and VWA domain-containing protein, partial [Gemmataceae bacterium]|nr:VIT and VWA domain-containing protein [Gemmataceae bacterium]